MAKSIDIEFVAQDANRACKRRDLIIVIDVVRATTSIITSLANGAMSVTPVQTLKEAMLLRKKHSEYLLAGERKGIKPAGFDLDNSPLSLTKENILGKHLIMSTTNGTRALVQSRGSKWVLVGAFVNADAVAKKSIELANAYEVGISLVLAGQENNFALEDFICAGGVIERLPKNGIVLSDKALGALLAFKGAEHNLLENMCKSIHSQELLKIGFAKDIEFACRINLYSIVPFYQNGVVQINESS